MSKLFCLIVKLKTTSVNFCISYTNHLRIDCVILCEKEVENHVFKCNVCKHISQFCKKLQQRLDRQRYAPIYLARLKNSGRYPNVTLRTLLKCN